jgi:hypothetical protein
MHLFTYVSNFKGAMAELLGIRAFVKHFMFVVIEAVPELHKRLADLIQEAIRRTMDEGFPHETFGPEVMEYMAKAMRKHYATWTPTTVPHLMPEERYTALVMSYAFHFAFNTMITVDVTKEQSMEILKKSMESLKGTEEEKKFIVGEYAKLMMTQVPESQLRQMLYEFQQEEKKKRKGDKDKG